jgi:hypothetical protein
MKIAMNMKKVTKKRLTFCFRNRICLSNFNKKRKQTQQRFIQYIF